MAHQRRDAANEISAWDCARVWREQVDDTEDLIHLHSAE
jgi:hypothetical protein